jgi:hypothetical protein
MKCGRTKTRNAKRMAELYIHSNFYFKALVKIVGRCRCRKANNMETDHKAIGCGSEGAGLEWDMEM